MPLLNYLVPQPIDADSDQDESVAERVLSDRIVLRDEIDEGELDAFWDQVVNDIHEDPDWFDFSND